MAAQEAEGGDAVGKQAHSGHRERAKRERGKRADVKLRASKNREEPSGGESSTRAPLKRQVIIAVG